MDSNNRGSVNQNDGASQQAAPATDNTGITKQDHLKELEEALYNTDGTLKFMSYSALASVPAGSVLVRRHFWTNNFSLSLLDRKRMKSTRGQTTVKRKVSKKIAEMTNEEINNLLIELKNRKNVTVAVTKVINLLEIEKKWRNDNTITRPQEILTRSVTYNKDEVINTRNSNNEIKTKVSGKKFRWIWHPKAIFVPLETFVLDTKSVKVDVQNGNGEEVEIDVDYEFEIVDPVKFLSSIDGKGKNAIRPHLDRYGRRLDQCVYDYVRNNGIDKINTDKDDLEKYLESLYDEIENELGLRFHINSKRVVRDKDFLKQEKQDKLADKAIEIAKKEAKAEDERLRPGLDAKEREARIAASGASWEFTNLLEELKKSSPNATDDELLAKLNQFIRDKHTTTRVDFGGTPFASQQPAPQQVQPQRQIVNNYSDDEIQNFVSLGICCQGGYLSTEDSINLCQSRGISFEGVVFHVGELNYYEMQALINSKKGPTR